MSNIITKEGTISDSSITSELYSSAEQFRKILAIKNLAKLRRNNTRVLIITRVFIIKQTPIEKDNPYEDLPG